MLESLTTSCGTPSVNASSASTGCSPAGCGAPDTAAAARATCAACAPPPAEPRSARTMRPPGPLPVNVDRSIPCASARRRASGEALTRSPPSVRGAGAAAAGGAAGVSPPPLAGGAASILGSSCLGGAASALGAGADALISSPSPAKIAIGVPTFTPSEPSGTRILAILPSSTASNSIVALSVSISARISPDLTSSPSLTSHLASVPSSIVGDSAGIFSELRSFNDYLFDFFINRLELVCLYTHRFEVTLGVADRVAVLAIFLHLLARSVARRVRHRVAAVAVRHELDQDRSLAAARPLERHVRGSAHRQHVHAVDLQAGDTMRFTAPVHQRLRRRACDRRAHRILIVFDDI